MGHYVALKAILTMYSQNYEAFRNDGHMEGQEKNLKLLTYETTQKSP